MTQQPVQQPLIRVILRGKVPVEHWLAIARASVALESHPDPQLAIPYHEHVGLFALAEENGIPPLDRLRQAREIIDFWPEPLLIRAETLGASWTALEEPTRWGEREAFLAEVERFTLRKHRWPTNDENRRLGGRLPPHRHTHDDQEELDL